MSHNPLKIQPLFFILSTLFCLTITPTRTSAFVAEDLSQLKQKKSCPGCDLRSADLRGLNLFDANLEGANLMAANLEGANLEDASLEDASLEKANLKNARMRGASMDHATVDGTDFAGADLQDVVWINGKPCLKGSIGYCKQ